MNYKEMIPVLEKLRQDQAATLYWVQKKNVNWLRGLLHFFHFLFRAKSLRMVHGHTPVSSKVSALVQKLCGSDLEVLGLDGYTEKVVLRIKGGDPELPEDASEEEWEADRKRAVARRSTVTLTKLIDHLKNS